MSHPLLSLHLAVLLFGLSGIFIGSIQGHALAVVLGRVAFSAAALLLLLCLRRKDILPKKEDVGLIVAGGGLLALHWICFVLSIQLGTVAIATITFATAPLTIALLEPMLYKEPRKPIHGVLALVTLGAVAITVEDFSLGNQALIATLWGLAAAVTYAFLTLVNRKVAPLYDGMQLSAWQHLVVAVVCIPLVLWQGASLAPGDLPHLACLGLICTAGGYVFFVQAQQRISAQTVALVSSLETLYSIVFAAVFLSQIPTLRQLLGGGVIMCVALWSSRRVTILPEKESIV